MDSYTSYAPIGEFEDCYGVWRPRQRRSSTKEESSLFHRLSTDVVEQTSDALISAKFEKLGFELLNDIYTNITTLCDRYVEQARVRTSLDIRFEVLQVDHANLYQLPSFYQQLKHKSKHVYRQKLFCGTMVAYNQEEITMSTKMTHLHEEKVDLPALLDTVCHSLKQQQHQQAQIYTSVFLVETIFTLPELTTLQKCIREEIEFNLPSPNHRSIVVVLPATEQLIVNYQLNGLIKKRYTFTDPRKMFTQLLIELIKNTQVPLFQRAIYKMLTDSFKMYATTYAEQLHQLKVGLYEYCKACPFTKRMEAYLNDEVDSKQFQEYLDHRTCITQGIEALTLFLQRLKKSTNEPLRRFRVMDTKSKLLQVICGESQSFFQVQASEDSLLEHLLGEFVSSIREKVHGSEELCAEIEMHVKLGYKAVKSKSRKDRAMMMVQASQDPVQKGLLEKKERLETSINKFMRDYVIDPINKLESQYSEYVFSDASSLQKHISPDILGDYHQLLYKDQLKVDPHDPNVIFTPIYHTRNLYTSIGAANSLVKASDLYNEMPTYQKYQKEAFAYCIGELKLLGLLEDTQKTQLTYQKTYFAKSAYQALNEFI